MVTGWTGRLACTLQSALRMSNEAFAAHLGVGVRTVASWHQKPSLRPRPEMQQILDSALVRAPEVAKERFTALSGEEPSSATTAGSGITAEAERRLDTDEHISAAFGRLEQLAGWEPGVARSQVVTRLAALDRRSLLDRGNRRGRVSRQRITDALGAYYRGGVGDYGLYGATFVGSAGSDVLTSVLTRPGWLDLDCPLAAGHDRLMLGGPDVAGGVVFDAEAAAAAVQRLAETLSAGTRFVDLPIYRLTGIDVEYGRIGGTLSLSQFGSYALTLDLLEGELADALAAGAALSPGALPLRDRYLPDLEAVLRVGDRLCAGGMLALCAFARPADPYRGPADYALLVQERSGSVVNAARQLAVIPKGFHQPLADFRSDARVTTTLLREMEEELFGRDDIDNTLNKQNAADPMHPARLSEPLRWLLAGNPSALRMECTGFGLNLVSGNFEFACLVVVDSEEFWSRFGGQVQANWESSSLRQYSSLDRESLSALASDASWSNEGLFAFLQGLRRLQQVGGDRVDVPDVDWMVAP
jgi:hypothetical protein